MTSSFRTTAQLTAAAGVSALGLAGLVGGILRLWPDGMPAWALILSAVLAFGGMVPWLRRQQAGVAAWNREQSAARRKVATAYLLQETAAKGIVLPQALAEEIADSIVRIAETPTERLK